MKSNLVILFFGDNGVHEFWESEDKQFCFIRNHGEKFWLAIRVADAFSNQGALTAKSLAQKVGRNHDYRFVFQVGQQWLRLYPHHRQMKLVTVPQPSY